MKLMHLSDLHLGKRLGNFPLEEDQQHILREILHIADAQKPDCILIAGDVFDKSIPPASAVTLFDGFLIELAARKIPTVIVSGNHDSSERLAYGRAFLEKSGIYISPVYSGKVEPVTLSDAHGEVRIYPMPFLRPAHVRDCFTDRVITGYDGAFAAAVGELDIDQSVRNVLIAHQYVSGATLSESEEIYSGSLECISAEHFAPFEYTALGHLHTPQNVGGDVRLRYCGTPLKYSYSERFGCKSVTFITLGAKGTPLEFEEMPLHPMRDLYELSGSFEELMAHEYTEDFVFLELTDKTPVADAQAKLRRRFGRIMRIRYSDLPAAEGMTLPDAEDIPKLSPYGVFAEFYQKTTGEAMTQEQIDFLEPIIQQIWEGQHETTEA